MGKKELRPYQVESIEGLREGFRNKQNRQVLCLSTGSGKSVILMKMVRSAEQKGSRVLFLCERRILVEQFSTHLDSEGIDHGILMAGHWRHRPHSKIQVASIQTIERMQAFPIFDICFIDEVHVMMRKSIVEMIKARPELRIVGATATPFNPKLADVFQGIVNKITMRELVDQGSLVPFRWFCSTEIDTSGVKVNSKGEWDEKEMGERGAKVSGDIVSDYVKISMELYGKNAKAITFSSGIAHGKDLVSRFSEVGVNAMQLTAESPEDYREQVFTEFKKPDSSIDMLISADMLTRGADFPDVQHVIIAKAIRKSFSSFVQIVGRGARVYPSKEFCSIQDHGGNYLRFEDDWIELYSDGVKELVSDKDSKTRKEKKQEEVKQRTCPRCTAVMPSGSDICPSCGYVKEKRSMVEEVPGQMQEIGKTSKTNKNKETSEQKERFYHELLGYAKEHGYKDGWAYHKYIERFSVGPAWKKEIAEPSMSTSSWIISRNIRAAKARRYAKA